MTDTQKYHLMRNAFADERKTALAAGRKHTAEALSELMLGGLPMLVSLYDHIDAATNHRMTTAMEVQNA